MNEYYAQKAKGQEEEIKTIKERTITLKLSDADCERIAKKAGKHSLTVGELLENFIGDLVGGTYSNGSDERDRAEQWFERCWFGMFPEETLLWYLLDWGHDVDDFLTVYDELKYYEANPEKYLEEVAEAKENGENLWFEDEYHNYVDEFLNSHKDIDINKEIELCRKWLADLEKLRGEEL